MAFNFNWSPLTADAGFYTRAQDLLTAALNKSPKPPIIVDDIVVTELNLGSVPPELEILEIGDLAEDRFRGIFKMSYSGDAFLTLKTRVQANPLNTYLLTRPTYASPKPVAAATGLTIPLQITLSNIKLSGFVVLVFSKQKGITVVFRNDPLESLKVSSTFDSIPFVRDYLQKEIEGQLRILFMDELPAIIHRLSLRLWVPDYRGQEVEKSQNDTGSSEWPAEDPLLNPPQDPVDASGNALSTSEIASLSLDSGVEMHSLFSQRNLLQLAALTDSQRTLSLFTPSISQVVYRAWTALAEQGDGHSGFVSPTSPALSRTHSHIASASHSFQDTVSIHSLQSRPALSHSNFSGYGINMGAGRHPKAHASRKRKKRVIDLRRPKTTDDLESVSGESIVTETASAPSFFQPSAAIPEESNDDPVTPPISPEATLRRSRAQEPMPRQGHAGYPMRKAVPEEFIREPAAAVSQSKNAAVEGQASSSKDIEPVRPILNTESTQVFPPEKANRSRSSSPISPQSAMLYNMDSGPSRSILEQAFMMKMAGEIARRIQDEKSASDTSSVFWDRHARDDTPPPAYGQ